MGESQSLNIYYYKVLIPPEDIFQTENIDYNADPTSWTI